MIILVIPFNALYGENPMSDIKLLLKTAESDLSSYAAPWEILYPESCKQLKKIGNESLETCINILVDTEISDLDKNIFINILAFEADFEQYTDLLSLSTKMYLTGNLKFTVFEYLFENAYIKHIIKKQYKNKKIRNIVNVCLKETLPEEESQFFRNLKKGEL